MVPPQCGWGRTAFGSTHEPRSTHNPPAGPPSTVGTRGPGRSSRIPVPSQGPCRPRAAAGDPAGPDRHADRECRIMHLDAREFTPPGLSGLAGLCARRGALPVCGLH